ncbi:hypothetical protein A5819_003473 [Enterococcus sp. 7E2_DIV0204]|nr:MULTISPECIES: hypothetical protein [unclassified Enterococcus]OTN83923.1 hypothetical protein A5819_003473 [Enterococcus sp. 7E2_DIV0204]OTP46831.1 hypothetical protein A5884_003709 [Enterococcus sp. 7D2_DIV0200]
MKKMKVLGSLLAAVLLILLNFERNSLFIAVLISYSLFQAMDFYHESKII